MFRDVVNDSERNRSPKNKNTWLSLHILSCFDAFLNIILAAESMDPYSFSLHEKSAISFVHH